MESTELAVVGAGPGGYAAAFRAADLGIDVTLVDPERHAGGVCLLRGCIPSKALLHAAHLIEAARDARALGLDFGEPDVDLERLRQRTASVVDGLASGVDGLARKRGVRRLRGRGRLRDARTLELEGEDVPDRLRFESAVLATGSLPWAPGPLRSGDERVMDSTAALALPDVPERLLVVGGGYIGLELGSVYAALGARVSVAEMAGSLLPGADPDLVQPLDDRLQERFHQVFLSTRVTGLEPSAEGVGATLEGPGVPPHQLYDRILVAVGRRPNAGELGLESTRAETDRDGFVRVDAQRRTAEPSLFAIGDLTGGPMLAHKATREGEVAAGAVAGEASAFDATAIPAVVFTDPEVAWCGLTETAARTRGRSVSVSRFPWSASGRAHTLGRREGLTKLVWDPETGRLLGAGVVGPSAGELIAEAALAVESAAVAGDVAGTIHAHPTLAETLGEAAAALEGRAIHIRSRGTRPRGGER